MRTLADELLLLAYDDEDGRPHSESMRLNTALAAAAIMELVADGVLVLEPEPKAGRPDRTVLRRTNAADPGDDLYAEIAKTADGKTVKTALSSLGMYSFRGSGGKLKDEILEDLVAEGVLTHERRKALGFIPYSAWPTADSAVEAEVLGRVRAVLVDGAEPDQRTASLITLMAPLDLARKLFPDEDATQLRARAMAIAKADGAGPALRQALDELTVVMMTTIMAPAIITSSGSGT